MRSRQAGLLQVLFTLALASPRAAPQIDPAAIQQRAVTRVDAYIDLYRRTGDRTSRLGDLREAAQELAISTREFRARNDWASAAVGLTKLGSAERMQGHWDASIAVYEQAEEMAVRANRPDLQAAVLSWRALAENSKRAYGEALTHATRAVRLAGDDAKLLFDALDQIARAHIGAGALSAASEAIERALSVATEAKDQTSLYYGYLGRADVFLKTAEQCDYKANFDECERYLDRAQADYRLAIEAARSLGFAGLADQAAGLARDVKLRRDLIQAQRPFTKIIEHSKLFHPKTPDDVLVTTNFVSGGDPLLPQITEMYDQMKAKAGPFRDVVLARDHYVRGMILQSSGRHDEALSAFLAAVKVLDADRRGLKDEAARGTFLEDKIGFYHAAMLQLLQHGRIAEAFEMMERSKSRSMADLLATRNIELSSASEQSLYSDLIASRVSIAARQSELFELAAGTGPPNPGRRSALEAQIRALEASHERLQARIAAEAPRLRELATATPARLEELKRIMREERFEMLEYVALDHAVILWHLSPDAVHVVNVFLPRAELHSKVGALKKSLEDSRSTFKSATADELFLFLIQPAIGWIRSERLIVIPHGDLHQLPFQVLRNPADARFVGERFQLSYAPSATVLRDMTRSGRIASGRLFAAADPSLDPGRREVLAIARLFGAESKLIVNRLPTKMEVREGVRDRDVVHLSVHGKFQANEPLQSYLVLGGKDGENKLTAAEMFGLPLQHTRLIVLSACETGKAEATQGDEILGMIRALLYARAGAVVLSYWKVDPVPTSLWMQEFYSSLPKQAPGEAARTALRALKAKKEYGHPHYWAAFMLIGR